MRLRQILDVNVIADARAVRRRIIRAVNLHLRFFAERHEQHVRNQMRLDAVMLAKFFARAGSVEIAEGDEIQLVNFTIPDEHFLEHQLGLAVRIDRTLRQILRHRHAVRRTVSRAGGAEDEFFHAAFHGGVRELERVDEVVVEIFFRVRHGLAYERERGEMQNRIRLHRLDGGENVPLLFRLGENKVRARIHRRAMAFREIVIHRDLMSGVEQFFRADGTNIAGTAGDKNVHAHSVEKFGGGESSK